MYKLTLCFEKLGTACRFIDAMNDADFTEITITKEIEIVTEPIDNDPDRKENIADSILKNEEEPVKARSTPERNNAMFELWQAGWTAKKIADEFHVSDKTVYNVVNRIKAEIGGKVYEQDQSGD